MEIYLDSANIDEIRSAAELGVLSGVTTNPTLIAKEGVDYGARLAAICEVIDGPVSAEVIATEAREMISEGLDRASIADNIVVKLPSTIDGLKACHTLAGEGIRTNLTLCFQPLQGLLVARAGAFLVSPFVGRLDGIGHDGIQLIRDLRKIFDNGKLATKVLAASIRHPQHVVACAIAGADVATLPYTVLTSLMVHPLTESGLQQFLDDYRKTFRGTEP